VASKIGIKIFSATGRFNESIEGTVGRVVSGVTGKSKEVSTIKSLTGKEISKGDGTKGILREGSTAVNSGAEPIEIVGAEIVGADGKALDPIVIEGRIGFPTVPKPTLLVIESNDTFG
jgi:hypothetical protein